MSAASSPNRAAPHAARPNPSVAPQPFRPVRRLSVAMIVRDGERGAADTLRAVASLADEVVVCDTGAAEDAAKTAAAMGARVLRCGFADDFSAARNHVLSHCCGDWTLWLEAGETLDANAAAALRQFIDLFANPAEAYLIEVKSPPESDLVSAEQVAQARLMPNRPGLEFTGRVRETANAAFARCGVTLTTLPTTVEVCVRRPLSDTDPAVRLRQARRDLRLAGIEEAETGESARTLLVRGDALAILGEKRAAVQAFRKATAVADRGGNEQLAAYYGLLTSLDGLDDGTAQLSICVEALGIFPLDAQLLCAMGGYLQRKQRLDLALRSYETAHRYGQIHPQVWRLQKLPSFVATCYAAALQLSDRNDKARQVLEEAAAAGPTTPQLRRHLIDLYVKMNCGEDAMAQVDLLPPDTPRKETLRSAVRGALLANQRQWGPAKAFLDVAYQAGCRDPICLRWLTVALMAENELARAQEVVTQWRRRDGASGEAAQFAEALRVAGVNVPGEQDPPGRRHTIRVDQAESGSQPPIGFGGATGYVRTNHDDTTSTT